MSASLVSRVREDPRTPLAALMTWARPLASHAAPPAPETRDAWRRSSCKLRIECVILGAIEADETPLLSRRGALGLDSGPPAARAARAALSPKEEKGRAGRERAPALSILAPRASRLQVRGSRARGQLRQSWPLAGRKREARTPSHAAARRASPPGASSRSSDLRIHQGARWPRREGDYCASRPWWPPVRACWPWPSLLARFIRSNAVTKLEEHPRPRRRAWAQPPKKEPCERHLALQRARSLPFPIRFLTVDRSISNSSSSGSCSGLSLSRFSLSLYLLCVRRGMAEVH